jgi:hypothetical protein
MGWVAVRGAIRISTLVIATLIFIAGVAISAAALTFPHYGFFHLKKISSSKCVSWILISDRGQIRIFRTAQTFIPIERDLPAWRPVCEWGSGWFARGPTRVPSNATNVVTARYPTAASSEAGWGSFPLDLRRSDQIADAFDSVEESWLNIPLWSPAALGAVLLAVAAVLLLITKSKLAHRNRGFQPVMLDDSDLPS